MQGPINAGATQFLFKQPKEINLALMFGVKVLLTEISLASGVHCLDHSLPFGKSEKALRPGCGASPLIVRIIELRRASKPGKPVRRSIVDRSEEPCSGVGGRGITA